MCIRDRKQNAAHVKELMQKAKFKVTTTKTSKKSVKVQGTAKTSKTLISDIKSLEMCIRDRCWSSFRSLCASLFFAAMT